MKNKIFYILPLTIFFSAVSCDTNEPPTNSNILLKLEDVSCTEAWIELTTTNLQLPTTITLKQTNPTGDTKSQILNLNTKDSLLYIDSLLPNKSYQYQVTSNQYQVSSNELSVTTMDTTSHNFTFETFTFGGTAGSSVLYDCTIISENNIWCVGEIYVADTSQNGYTMYNASHWNGNNWELKLIPFTGSCSAVMYPPIRSIWAFSETDIWFARGGSLVHFDGTNYYNDCNMNSLLTGSMDKIWGTSSEDLYVVGNNGNIIHYNGTVWSWIESGTELNINDIWGDYNEKTGEWEILAVASNILQSNEKEVFRINTTTTQIINKDGITGTISSVWFKNKSKYYIAGGGG